MTIGIYKLSFPSTHRVYIGQSVDIELRFTRHKRMLKEGLAPRKLQYAFDTYGEPQLEVLCSCTEEELDFQEKCFISQYDSHEDGFNGTDGGSILPDTSGTNNANAKYKEEDYFCVLLYLSEPGYSWKQIAALTGVSEYVISHISSLESHKWLKDKFPELYAKVEHIKYSGGRNYAHMQGIKYPKIKSPEGVIHEVLHQTNFAKEHGLSQPKLCEVLHGNRKTHKGWSLAEPNEK